VAECKLDEEAFPATPPSHGTKVGATAVTVSGGVIPESAEETFASAGKFFWAAFYSGDTNNKAAASDCKSEPLEVTKASPGIETKLASSSIELGGKTHDTAKLTGTPSASAGGTVEYRLYKTEAECKLDAEAFPTAPSHGTKVGATAVTVSGGVIPESAEETFASAGTFYWAAFYSGDTNNKPAASGCGTEKLTVFSITAQITPTNTTCEQFVSGTAGTLKQVEYQTRGKTTIQNAQPGVFFYFVKFTAKEESFTVEVPQKILSGTGPLFGIFSTTAFTSPSCTTFKSIKVEGTFTDVIKFEKATVGQAYVVAVKYSPKSIVSKPKPSPANITYMFKTFLGGSEVLGSEQTVNLVKTG
jgi:hypothetical protein